MICSKCKATETRVIETRKYETTIMRIRKCKECGYVWTTWENKEKSEPPAPQNNYSPQYSTR